MSEELNDDMVIGIVAEAVQDGPNTYHSEPIPVTPNDLDEKNREYWRIGKGACEAADKANPYAIGLLAGGLWLVVAGRPKQSCPIELIQTLDEAHTHGYAAGLAAAGKRIAELEKQVKAQELVIQSYAECEKQTDGVLAREKKRRIHWQDLAYAAMNFCDGVLRSREAHDTTTEFTLKESLAQISEMLKPNPSGMPEQPEATPERDIERDAHLLWSFADWIRHGNGLSKIDEDGKEAIRKFICDWKPHGDGKFVAYQSDRERGEEAIMRGRDAYELGYSLEQNPYTDIFRQCMWAKGWYNEEFKARKGGNA